MRKIEWGNMKYGDGVDGMLDKPKTDMQPAPGWRFPRFLRFSDKVRGSVYRIEPTEMEEDSAAPQGIENRLHWTLDVTFDEDRCRTRKDDSPLNLAIIHHAGVNILNADKSRGSLRRKRLRACVDPEFRTRLFAC